MLKLVAITCTDSYVDVGTRVESIVVRGKFVVSGSD